mmetsp:Transcript_6967/g.21191  ORF Transcript_6967/g.21191 Transcript_6967/m.21191 type:complete len:227 (+) Transcript_6967:104-784(+)
MAKGTPIVRGSLCHIEFCEEEGGTPRTFKYIHQEKQAVKALEDAVASMKPGESKIVWGIRGHRSGVQVKLVEVIPPPEANMTAEQHRVRGNNYVASQLWTLAVVEYRKGLHELDNSEDDLNLEASLRLNLALSLSKLKRWREAASMCDRVIEIDPSRVKAYYRRGTAWLALGEYILAVTDLERAHMLAPEDSAIVTNLNCAKQKEDEQRSADREDFKRTYQVDVQW